MERGRSGLDECQQISAIVRATLERSTRPIAAAWLFGSIARGEARPDSDVDVGLLLREEPCGTLADLPAELEVELERATGRPAQVVVLNTAPTELAMNVLADGQLLVERDPVSRVDWEVKTLKAYWDLVPLLEIYRRAGEERR